uniref:CDPK adapter protein 1 n=2 Tax=Pentapetalae TaxID=1437201 RepID=Q94F64_MESCR|nr:CDPK adapter protein 1 [Mesembryanthemum crystallinum]
MTCQNEEASGREEELMDVDIADASNGCITEIKENGLLLWPVLPQEQGEGLPYAPVNWPNPGDIWGWRVGRRIAASGYHLDRYLYLPARFQKSRRKRDGFASKLSVEQYVRARFPGTDVNAFFSSFSWKIPSKHAYLSKDEHGSVRISSEEVAEQSPSGPLTGTAVCKAGNRFCSSLLEEEISPSAAAQSCDVCCSEPSFCRDCSCILCCNTIDLAYGGYSFIRCEAIVHDDVICGHAAHINCALRSYMAGTVGGSVGLDTEYYCRRCDTRTDLTKHVTKLLKTCESIESRDDIEKMLNVASCLLRGSQKKGSERLLNHIESALQKLKGGSDLQDVWKLEVDVMSLPTGQLDYTNYVQVDIDENNLSHQNECLKLEVEIDQVLHELRRSQEVEYRLAQERLRAQKDHLSSLYQQMDKEKSELTRYPPSTNRNALLSSVIVKEEYIQCELSKLKNMEKVAKGFGKTPKEILKEHFNLDFEE